MSWFLKDEFAVDQEGKDLSTGCAWEGSLMPRGQGQVELGESPTQDSHPHLLTPRLVLFPQHQHRMAPLFHRGRAMSMNAHL